MSCEQAAPDTLRPAGRRLPSLDGLRAAACLAVFGVHFQQITGAGGRLGPLDLGLLLENGNTGVCLFLVLSGFLLSLPFWDRRSGPGLLHSSKAGVRAWLGPYALGRMARIVPAYFLCLTVLWLLGGGWRSGRGVANLLLHYAFLHNLSPSSLYGINPPFWALAVIVQFYAVLPLLLLPLGPLRSRRLLGAGVVAILAVAAYGAHAWLAGPAGVSGGEGQSGAEAARGLVMSHSLLAHLPHFLLGIGAAAVFAGLCPAAAGAPEPRAWPWDAVFCLSAAAILLILGIPEWNASLCVPHGRYHLPYIPLLVAAMVLCAPRARMAGRVLNWSPVRLLGIVSYGVYIYHLPCMKAVAGVMDRVGRSPGSSPAIFALTAFAASVGVSTVSYLLLERPVLRWAMRRTARPAPSP